MKREPWPPGFVAEPVPKPGRSPLQYLRMRQTALSRGHTGTIVDAFKAPNSNIPDPAKARLDVPARRKKA